MMVTMGQPVMPLTESDEQVEDEAHLGEVAGGEGE